MHWKFCLFAISIVLLAGFASGVVINEVELNPAGDDSGGEWIEIYNDGNSISIDGWYLEDSSGDRFVLPDLIFGAGEFYVLDVTGLLDSGESIGLYAVLGSLQDETGILIDEDDSLMTWGRLPDGTGDFVFRDGTRGFPNEETVISNLGIDSTCVLESDDVMLGAEVTGFCVEEVRFLYTIDEVSADAVGVFGGGNEYFYTIPQTELNRGGVDWNVFVRDCFDRTIESDDESFYVNARTLLEIFPEVFDGNNGWRVTEPVISLSNADATEIFYQWNSDEVRSYSGPFGLEDKPNPPLESGGLLRLSYFSNVCQENMEIELLNFDLFDSLINELEPLNGSVTSGMPEISAVIDEVYGSNSGINIDSVFMFLDGEVIEPSLTELGNSVFVSFVPETVLSEGKHEVMLTSADNAGRTSSVIWEFDVVWPKTLDGFSMDIGISENELYTSRRIPLEIELSREVSNLEYSDLSSSRPRVRRLCRNCESYGIDRPRYSSFSDGRHELEFVGKDSDGNVITESVVFSVDTRAPRIVKTEPRRGFTGGRFFVEFDEANPSSLELFYGQDIKRNSQIDLSNCQFDRRYKCEVQVDLNEFDGESIEYFFKLEDIAGNSVSSRSLEVDVDISQPIIDDLEIDILGRRVVFEVSVFEENFASVQYMDLNDRRPRFRPLCSRLSEGICERGRSFRNGDHVVLIRAFDKGGLFDEKEIMFII